MSSSRAATGFGWAALVKSKDPSAEAVEKDQQRGDDAREVHDKREKSESTAEWAVLALAAEKAPRCVVINFSRAVNGGAGQPGAAGRVVSCGAGERYRGCGFGALKDLAGLASLPGHPTTMVGKRGTSEMNKRMESDRMSTCE